VKFLAKATMPRLTEKQFLQLQRKRDPFKKRRLPWLKYKNKESLNLKNELDS
jgi:hypothetical protein